MRYTSADGKRFISLRLLTRSFGHAFRGLWQLLLKEQNARIHFLVAIAVLVLGCVLGLALWEWCMIVLACGGVVSAEAFNTALERLSDVVSPHYNEQIRKVKDYAAGAVLIMSITAGIVGGIIFIPKLIMLF
jgi:diacylglycerol kinase (ATP)